MKTLLTAVLVLLSWTTTARGQRHTTEREIRRFLAEYEKGKASRDIQFLEQVIPHDYTYTGPTGAVTSREGTLRHFKRKRDDPGSTRVSVKHENVRVHAVGNMALVTHDWTALTTHLDAKSAEPMTDKGRYTGVLEKRNGRWLVLAEHDSERLFEDQWMVSGVVQASLEYSRVTERLQGRGSHSDRARSDDSTALGRLLADEYSFTGPDGVFLNREQAIARFVGDPGVARSITHAEQKVRTIGNGMAVETGRVTRVGIGACAVCASTQRHTRVWAFYDGSWQMTANHVSPATSQDVPAAR